MYFTPPDITEINARLAISHSLAASLRKIQQSTKMKRKAHAQIAHLVFADTQNINPKKPKEQFFTSHENV